MAEAGFTPAELESMPLADIEAIATYHMTHSGASAGGDFSE
jgi:hypothetical protein